MSEEKQWQEFFENFSYKPNVTFQYQYQIDYDRSRVNITMWVPDSRRDHVPETTPWGRKTIVPLVPIDKVVMLERWYNEERAKEFIWFHLHDLEIHEMGEWFKYKGERPYDPHKADV